MTTRTVRMLPPVSSNPSPTNGKGGRNYSVSAGSYLDVPVFDANLLEANGWTRIGLVGATSGRPLATDADIQRITGVLYVDTTLNAVVIGCADGKWRNVLTGAVA